MKNDKDYQELGLLEGEVRLCHYDARWPEIYEKEERRIKKAFSGISFHIEHVGSTAVPGMVAKPIIDIGFAVDDFNNLKAHIERLSSLDYEYRGECGVPDRHFFRLLISGKSVFHLHLVRKEDEHWENFLLFRDALRSNGEIAERYSTKKKELEKEFSGLREEYTLQKDPVIRQILDQARASGGTQQDDETEPQ